MRQSEQKRCVPERRSGQVWHIEYSGWNGTKKDFYYLLLQRFDSDTQERWWVWDLEEGRMGYAKGYSMPFEAEENGDWQYPYYRLLVDVES